MKNKLILQVSLFISFLIFVGCEEDPVFYELTTSISPTNGGVVTPSKGTFELGEVVELYSTSKENYKFKNWGGDISKTSKSIVITMDSNKNITAIFELLDTDGDGVTDDIDTCPDTPSGNTVDSNGCAENFDVIYGISTDDNILYKISLDDGNLTPSYNPSLNLSWELEYLPSSNQIISTVESGTKLLILDLETNQSTILTFSEDKSIERVIVTKNDIVYGISNDDNILYKISLDDGSLIPSYNPSMNLSWELEYLPSLNQIISTVESGTKLLILDLETNQSTILTFSEDKAIERVIVTKNDIVYGISNDDNILYKISLDDGNLTPSYNPSVNLSWELEYLPSSNQIISTVESGTKLLILDLEINQSTILTFSEDKAIERLVLIEK